MASDNEASCESDPNFAVICAFFDKFGETCGLANFDFLELQEMLENTQEVHQQLIDLHIRLLRRAKKTVSNEKWERAIIKFCHTFCIHDAWEIERFGYKKSRISSKLRVLKELLELQFDLNSKFKSEINKMSAEELRSQPLGKDNLGHAYWYQSDNNCQIRVYKEDPDEETWILVAKDRNGLVSLINDLSDGDSKISSDTTMNEDSNSLAEKPIIDTGQTDSSDSKNTKIEDSDSNSKEPGLQPVQEAAESDRSDLKRARESDGETSPLPKRLPQEEGKEEEEGKDEEEEEVGEAIEEPLMLVKGQGAGADNCYSPIVGDAIEDPVVLVCGSGSGSDCLTGNDNKSSDSAESDRGNKDSAKEFSISGESDGKNCPYKLGTIVDTKTDGRFGNRGKSPTKKSRWDVETLVRKEPESSRNEEKAQEEAVVPKKPMFFFGPGCLAFKPKVVPASCSATMGFGQKVPQVEQQSQNVANNNKCEEISVPDNAKGDIGYRIENVEREEVESEETHIIEKKSDEIEPEFSSKLSGEDESIDAAEPTEVEELKISTEVPKEKEIGKPSKEIIKEQLPEKLSIKESEVKSETEQKKVQEITINNPKVESQKEVNKLHIESSRELDKLQMDVQKKTQIESHEELGKLQSEVQKEPDIISHTKPATLQIENFVKDESIEVGSKVPKEADVKINKVENTKEEKTPKLLIEVPKEPVTLVTENLEEPKSPELSVEVTEECLPVEPIISEPEVSKVLPSLDVKPIESTPNNKMTVKETVKTEVATDLTMSNLSKIEDQIIVTKDEELICDKPKGEPSTLSSALVTKEIVTVGEDKTSPTEPPILPVLFEVESDSLQEAGIVSSPKESDNKVIAIDIPEDIPVQKVVKAVSPEPVVEEICKKKLAYICGGSSEKEDSEKQETLIITEEVKEVPPKINDNIEEFAENLTVNDKENKSNEIPEMSNIDIELPPPVNDVNETAQDLSKTEIVDEIAATDLSMHKEKTISDIEEVEKPQDLTLVVSKVADLSPSMEGKEKPSNDKVNNTSTPSEKCLEIDEKLIQPDLDVAKDDKPIEEMTEEKTPTRRGRPKGTTKAEITKKMKMNESEEEPRSTRNTRSKPSIENSEITSQEVANDKPADEDVEKQDPLQILPPVASLCEASDSDQSDGNDVMPDNNSEEEEEEKPPVSLSTFSLDFIPETPIATPSSIRGVRKRGRESPTNDLVDEDEETAKRIKIRGRRSVDVQLRKSIEEQKKQELASSDDEIKDEEDDDDDEAHPEAVKLASPVKKRGRKKRGFRGHRIKPLVTKTEDGDVDSQEISDKKSKNKNKRLLSNLGITLEEQQEAHSGIVGVRQSRRIAQLKIKEEAERRKIEEDLAKELELDQDVRKKSKKHADKDYKVKSKKKKSSSSDDDDDNDDDNGEDVPAKSEKKKKKKKRQTDPRKLFDGNNPWRSSSDSSSSNVEEEDEEIEEDYDHIQYNVSDHEFSPESDLEADEAQPLKRARTARKESDVEEEVDDCPCQKCSKSDHPEWILLCDSCDNGWHCSCLRPPLLVIPEGDWFCPPCQHIRLLNNLQLRLKEYDKLLNKKEIADRRKERLAYVGISLNNVLPTKDNDPIVKKTKKRRHSAENEEDEDDSSSSEVSGSGSESESESGSQSEGESDSDEPIYQLRQRRQAHSYRFNDYDELINSAIQDEMEAVKGAGNQGRGKDIATIVNAEKEEEWAGKEGGAPAPEEAAAAAEAPEALPPVVPEDTQPKPVEYEDDDDVVKPSKKSANRKKHRKLNALDISSEDDDEGSDEDFKGTSGSEEEFDEDELNSEETDDEFDARRGRRKLDPVRRSTRARTSRYDADFIDDGDSEDEDAPRRKKKRSIWDESESEESDKSWGRRKKKPARIQKRPQAPATSKKKKSKKKKKNSDSDAEVYKKKKPKIKFGLDGEDEGPGRRTRGKKINYVDALGSDSDEERVKRAPPRIESEEEEYVANEDEEIDEDDKITDEDEDASAEEGATSKIQIQSYADAKFSQPLPEGVPTPKMTDAAKNREPNAIDEINKNLEAMDENEMEKMMEEEEYANKQLHMVAVQIEKEKKRKEREAKKLEEGAGAVSPSFGPVSGDANTPKKRGRKPKGHFQFAQMQDQVVGNADSVIVNTDNNDELSEPPGVSLPLFANLGVDHDPNDPKKRRSQGVVVQPRNKKSIDDTVASLGMRQDTPPGAFMGLPPPNKDLPGQETNIEIAAPPQPFSQSQPTPSVITRMLQSKPGQAGYPVGAIRPKQFAAMPEREEEPNSAAHHPIPGQFLAGAVRPPPGSPYRQMLPMNHYPRGGVVVPPPHQIRNPVPHGIYHPHRSLDPSPSGGGAMSMAGGHASPGRVASPAAGSPKGDAAPPPPYARPAVARFPPTSAAPRHLHMVGPHLQPPRPSLGPYHPNLPPSYHYGPFASEEGMAPGVYQTFPPEQFAPGEAHPSENSNSKSYDEGESGGEFGGLVSYFSSQREDDLES